MLLFGLESEVGKIPTTPKPYHISLRGRDMSYIAPRERSLIKLSLSLHFNVHKRNETKITPHRPHYSFENEGPQTDPTMMSEMEHLLVREHLHLE